MARNINLMARFFYPLFEQKPQYYIGLMGLVGDSIGSVLIDKKFGLIQLHASHLAAIVPFRTQEYPEFHDIAFYTNCLSYEHEIPAYIFPSKRKALTNPIEKGSKKFLGDMYFDAISSAYEAINSMRFGPLTYVYFRWEGFDRIASLPYSMRYENVSKELSLYSTALRQLDPLSEFLDYYRIIESISENNGKDWIVSNLDRIKNYNFGFLEFESDHFRYQYDYKKRKNLFTTYKRRAQSRIQTLKSKLSSYKAISEYFYNENRCGIAHGKTNIKTYDFGNTIEEISKDIFVIKLLARMGIEDNLNSNYHIQ